MSRPLAAPEEAATRARWGDRPRSLRWSVYAALLLVLALVAGSVVALTTVRRSLPQTSGTLALDGLRAEVEVVRDAHGIPQLYAEDAHDLFLAQGFVQAQDRFFQMEVRRHQTAGRLSELFGPATLEVDKAVRAMGWRRVARQELSLLSPRTRSYLEAFSDGVNAYIGSRSPGEMALELALLDVGGVDHRVEKWTPTDSVAWLKAMAWDLRGNMQDEIDRVTASAVLDAARVADLYPPFPYARHRPVVSSGAVVDGGFDAQVTPGAGARPPVSDGVLRALEDVRRTTAAVPGAVGANPSGPTPGGLATGLDTGLDTGLGSNAWVVDGAHSTTGAPLLANDPHLAPTLPGVWYQMGLHCTEVDADCPFDVAGFTFAGFPGVIIGHNASIAWGFTNLNPDVTDLYLEAVKGQRYLRGRTWKRLDRRTETIAVAGEEPVTFTVRSSVHGPLLSDVSATYASAGTDAPVPAGSPGRGTGYAVALAWTALTPNRTADAVFGINEATDWSGFREAARDFAAPSQNMVYADTAGHIGYQAPGLVPLRRAAHDGRWPAPGWDRAYDWTGEHVPFDALPSVLDPEEGWIVTANQAVVGPAYPYYLGDSWSSGYRSERIAEVLTRKGRLGVDDMSRLQLDSRNGFAPRLVPYLLDVDAGSRYYAAGQRLLESWDFTQPADSAAAAYFNAVWRNLLASTFHDQLPVEVRPNGGDRWFEVVSRLLEEPGNPWWDDVGTEEVREGRDDVLRTAVRDARDELVRLQSRRPDGWTWGHHHTLELENQSLGRSGIGVLEGLLNRGPWELGGGSGIVNATAWNAAQGYEVTAAPSMRMVVSMADPDASRWVSLTGASGHAFDDHYTDQTDLWSRGETLGWPFTRAAVDAAAADRLLLTPGEPAARGSVEDPQG